MSGPEALTFVTDFLPQGVLLDIALPGRDGLKSPAGFAEHLAKSAGLNLLNEWLRTRL